MEQHSKDLISSALELAKIGFFRYLFDGTILAFDQSAFDFFELEGIFKDPQSVVGQNIESLLIYTGSPRRLRKEIRKKGKVVGMEYGFKTLKGNEKWGVHNSFVTIDKKTGKKAIQVCFYDITELKKTEEELKKYRNHLEEMIVSRTTELKQKTVNLEETNVALKILLEQRKADKKEIEKNMLNKIEKLVLPYLDKLKDRKLDHEEYVYINIIESNLKEITSHLSPNLFSQFSKLTPTEIQIADMIRMGKATKEIAELLKLSPTTIATHRQNIRKKLALTNKKMNLRTILTTNKK